MHRDRESSSRFTERYIYDPKVRNLNNDWIGDSIKESLLTLLGVKIHLWLCFIKKKKKKSSHFLSTTHQCTYKGSEVKREAARAGAAGAGKRTRRPTMLFSLL